MSVPWLSGSVRRIREYNINQFAFLQPGGFGYEPILDIPISTIFIDWELSSNHSRVIDSHCTRSKPPIVSFGTYAKGEEVCLWLQDAVQQ
jgi:hypothetical protein